MEVEVWRAALEVEWDNHREGTAFYSKAEQHAGTSDRYFQNMILSDELKIDKKELDWK